MKDSRLVEIATTKGVSIIQAFSFEDSDKLGNVLICIDEAQNFTPNSFHIYADTEANHAFILNQRNEMEKWNQFVREIIRYRSNTFILANTSSFELLKNSPSVNSPFDKSIFYAKYFSKAELLAALELIEGKGLSRIPFSQQVLIDILEFIISETNGYPGICGYIFAVLNDIVKQVRSTAYSVARADIIRIWKEKKWQLLLDYLEVSRLLARIREENINDLNSILNSPIILGGRMPCDISLAWVRIGLRCGIFKVVDDELTLSCNNEKYSAQVYETAAC